MFAIYNIKGRTFRDSLEALYQVRQPHTVHKPNIQSDIAQDETTVIQGLNTKEATSNAQNIASYREMLHANEGTEIVHTYQLMTHPVLTIYTNQTLEELHDKFIKYGVNQLPVITPQLEIIGLVDRVETLEAVYRNNGQVIEDIMQTEVITVDPISDVRRVARVLHEYQLSALPVVNQQDHLVGIITKTDLLKALIKEPPLSLWA